MEEENKYINKKKYNIAILLPTLDRGGAERVATELSHYFHERNYNVYLFVNKLNRVVDYPYSGTAIEIPKEDYKELLIFKNKIAKLISLKAKAGAIRKLKKKYHIDYSISFMDEYNLLNVMSRYRDKTFIRICDVMSVSGVARENGWDFAPIIIGHYYNQATRVIVVNGAEKKDLSDNYFVHKEKFCKIINPIRSVQFKPSNREWGFGGFGIVCVGRIIEIKQQHHIVRAFQKVKDKCPKAKLIFIGNGESKYFQYVRQLTIAMNLTNDVIFEGRQTDIGFYLNNGKVFVSASRTEGYPNCVLEAMTVGIPVVAADGIGGVGEILNDNENYEHPINCVKKCRYGILTPQIDGTHYSADTPLTTEENLLAQAITDLLLDESLHKKYYKVASQYIKANDISTVGRKWEELFADED